MSAPEPNPDYCDRCELIDEGGPREIIGTIDGEDVCHMCRMEELRDETLLSEREALTVAIKQLTDMSHADISDVFEPSKSSIDEYSSRANAKLAEAKRTVDLVGNDA